MRLVFVGASSLGKKVLENVLQIPDVEVVGVITSPPEFEISYSDSPVRNFLHADFHDVCSMHSIPILESRRGFAGVGPDYISKEWQPDMFLVVGWYHMVPASWLQRWVFLGVHASLLPAYSGGAPLVWAMINGERRAGVSIFRLGRGVDDGPLAGQESFEIEEEDYISDVLAKAEKITLRLVQSTLERIVNGTLEFIPQSGTGGSIYPQRKPEDGKIDPHMGSGDMVRFIRAQSKPYPGAFFETGLGRLYVWRVELSPQNGQAQRGIGFSLHESSLYFLTSDFGIIRMISFEFQAAGEHGITQFVQDFNSRCPDTS